QREPFLRLFHAIIVKFVIHLPRAQRGEQIATDILGELAGVDDHCDERRHAEILGWNGAPGQASRAQNKSSSLKPQASGKHEQSSNIQAPSSRETPNLKLQD